MILEKRFNIGDEVTYLPQAMGKSGKYGYRFGGLNLGGRTGFITKYYDFEKDHQCWSMQVTAGIGETYKMLESEFKEYLSRPIHVGNDYPIY